MVSWIQLSISLSCGGGLHFNSYSYSIKGAENCEKSKGNVLATKGACSQGVFFTEALAESCMAWCGVTLLHWCMFLTTT